MKRNYVMSVTHNLTFANNMRKGKAKRGDRTQRDLRVREIQLEKLNRYNKLNLIYRFAEARKTSIPSVFISGNE